jgi:hypothetical protein
LCQFKPMVWERYVGQWSRAFVGLSAMVHSFVQEL